MRNPVSFLKVPQGENKKDASLDTEDEEETDNSVEETDDDDSEELSAKSNNNVAQVSEESSREMLTGCMQVREGFNTLRHFIMGSKLTFIILFDFKGSSKNF